MAQRSSIAASDAGSLSVAADRAPLRHVVIPFTPITLVCRDIQYYVPDPAKGKGANKNVIKDSGDPEIEGKLRLLNGIDFFAQPANLTALMGGSGAGKTTLMVRFV